MSLTNSIKDKYQLLLDFFFLNIFQKQLLMTLERTINLTEHNKKFILRGSVLSRFLSRGFLFLSFQIIIQCEQHTKLVITFFRTMLIQIDRVLVVMRSAMSVHFNFFSISISSSIRNFHVYID